MQGQCIEAAGIRRAARLIGAAAFGALWLLPGAAHAAPPANGEAVPYRPLVLVSAAAPEPGFLYPIHGRGLKGTPTKGPVVKANWRKMTIPAGDNGHFFVTARVKKQPPSYSLVDITFLVDTGASLVALTRSDARSLGFNVRDLDFSGVSQTANGEVRFASVVLPELRVGTFKVQDVPASVVDGQLEISLLGNSFLSRLKSYEVAGGELVLRW